MNFTSLLSKIKNVFGSDVKTGRNAIYCDIPRNAQVYPSMTVFLTLDCGAVIKVSAKTCAGIYDGLKSVCVTRLQGTFTMTREDVFDSLNFVVYYQNKPLRNIAIPLLEYNIKHGDVLHVRSHLGIGGSTIEPPYTCYVHVRECERIVVKTTTSMRVQSWDTDLQNILQHVHKNLGHVFPNIESDWVAKQIENFHIIKNFSSKCVNFHDYMCMAQLSYRLFTGEVLSHAINQKISRVFSSSVQSSDIGTFISTCRNLFNGAKEVTDCETVRKLVNLYSYLLTQGYLRSFNLTLSDEDYSKFEQRAMLSAYSSKKAFYVCVIDVTLYICERLHEYSLTGQVSSFLSSSDNFKDWVTEADRIINLAPFTGNLAPHGTSYFSFLSDLRDSIEKGEAYVTYLKKTTQVDPRIMSAKLNHLKMLQNTEITRRAAQQERAAPMGILVYGSSSVGKSAFTKAVFNYYGALFDLDRDDQYRYVRNPLDEYWSNFDTSKWCIQLDDIAFKNPTKTNEIDSTLQDMLNVVNNVPYVPPQAALEDKGKTPVLAKLVIATTNCASLNAREYFWCPLAIRRRLPYVVSIKPKNEFLQDNMIFIDPLKLEAEDGAFPDFWNITVQRIVPRLSMNREFAELETVATFDHIDDFLQHFGKACFIHEQNQKKAMAKDKDMLKIEICKSCYKPSCKNECVHVQFGDESTRISYRIFNFIWDLILGLGITLTFFMFWLRFTYTRRIALSFINRNFGFLAYVDAMRLVERYRTDVRLRRAITCLSALTVAMGIYSMYRSMQDKEHETDAVGLEVQGNIYGTTEEQLQKEDAQNVWYNPNIELTNFDMPIASTSMVGKTDSELRNLLSNNCVILKIRIDGEDSVRIMRGVFVSGHMCVTNGHAFKKHGETFTVQIIRQGGLTGLNSNVTFPIKRSQINFSKYSDLCVFEVLHLPPFKNILKIWTDTEIYPSNAVELSRQLDGSLTMNKIFNLSTTNIHVEELGGDYDVFLGVSNEVTEDGLCGSLVFSNTPRGPVIIGLHFLGNEHSVGILSVKKSEIEDLLPKKIIVQSGEKPLMECPDRKYVLGNVHHRSIIRYVENGNANTYGSFEGFRPKPKSKVCATPLQKEMLDHYGTTVGYGPPVMKGWEPWRNNIMPMLEKQVLHDQSILNECIESFAEDIINSLPIGWEKELVILSDRAAVNGLPGVKFIDRLNISSSMGFPWATTKKKYIYEDKDEKYPDGVNFTEEVWGKIRAIEEKYLRGERANPVYTGHLKDEAVPFAKIAKKKTRLFTAAPADWSVVVRKYLLSFVRLVQKNKFVFEAAPGVVCQSREWTDIFDYLTAFGRDRLVAGDYEKFDKNMLAHFILAAYEVIKIIFAKAGFENDVLTVLSCIAEDTAFPLCNINGDLIEFFGCNPSGHPLTVIINSLANSLYMRYCYRVLNPSQEVKSFKSNVHLLTYGDDNTFGVSRFIDWFNHTTIQRELKNIGVGYTMADKLAESVPFINIDEVSFLKRSWVWSDDLKAYMCPLEEESIIKSLTVWVPSGTIDQYKQMTQVISSASQEYFFYGKEKFEEKRNFFSTILSQYPYNLYVCDSTLPTYDQLVERHKRASCSRV